MAEVEIALPETCAGVYRGGIPQAPCPLFADYPARRCLAARATVEEPYDRRPLWCPLEREPVTLRVREARRDG